MLFLLKYYPDLNDIEHDFSALKIARMYSPSNTSIYEIIRNYCANNVSFLFFQKNYMYETQCLTAGEDVNIIRCL